MIFILFVVSLIVLFVMLASKVWEIKVRRINILAEVYTKADKQIHIWIGRMIYNYHRQRKIVHIFFFDFLPSYIYKLLVKLKDYLAKYYYSTNNQFRGKRMLREGGSVSAFLQNISDKPDTSHNKI